MQKDIMLWISQQKVMIRPHEVIFGFIPSSEKFISKYIPKKHLYWTSSGRDAISSVVNYLSKDKKRRLRIAMPAFTCQVVYESIENLASDICYYDSSIKTTINDIKNCIKKNKKIDVLILCYNFGYLPENLNKITQICKDNNIIIIEDCAQALGSTQNNQLAGSFGDYATYSFGLSKNIGFDGGMIASNKELFLPAKRKQPLKERFKSLFEAIIAPVYFSPLFFSLGKFLLNRRVHPVDNYPKKNYQISKFTKNIVCHLAKRYNETLKKRRDNYFTIDGKKTTSSALYYYTLTDNREELIQKANAKNVQLEDMKSFKCFDSSFPKAKKAEQNHLTFALLRSKKELLRIKNVIFN